jgi:hypothetical protein
VTILTISNLLVSEIGGFDDDVFDVHVEGLVKIVDQRNGISELHESIATTITLYVRRLTKYFSYLCTALILFSGMLCFTILRGDAEPLMLRDFAPRTTASIPSHGDSPVSPLYAPHGDLTSIYGLCSAATFEVLNDMHNLTQTYLARWRYVADLDPASSAQVASCDAQLQQIYTRLLQRPSTQGDPAPDWVYESCRLAALIYCRSIVHGASFADSAATMYAHSTDHEVTGMTLLSSLHAATMQIDARSCWGDMRSVFLWVTLIGGAAAWPQPRPYSIEDEDENSITRAWIRKCFALYAIRAAVSVPFHQAGPTIEALRTMLQVRHWLDLSNGGQRISF